MSGVATTRPPITAQAIGPQNTVGAIGIMPRMAAAAVSRFERKRCSVATITASPSLPPLGDFRLDLVDQHDRIAGLLERDRAASLAAAMAAGQAHHVG